LRRRAGRGCSRISRAFMGRRADHKGRSKPSNVDRSPRRAWLCDARQIYVRHYPLAVTAVGTLANQPRGTGSAPIRSAGPRDHRRWRGGGPSCTLLINPASPKCELRDIRGLALGVECPPAASPGGALLSPPTITPPRLATAATMLLAVPSARGNLPSLYIVDFSTFGDF
jgi:hypothetical protein